MFGDNTPLGIIIISARGKPGGDYAFGWRVCCCTHQLNVFVHISDCKDVSCSRWFLIFEHIFLTALLQTTIACWLLLTGAASDQQLLQPGVLFLLASAILGGHINVGGFFCCHFCFEIDILHRRCFWTSLPFRERLSCIHAGLAASPALPVPHPHAPRPAICGSVLMPSQS